MADLFPEPVTDGEVSCPSCLGGELDTYRDTWLGGPGEPAECGRCQGTTVVDAKCSICARKVSDLGVLWAEDLDVDGEPRLLCGDCVQRETAEAAE